MIAVDTNILVRYAVKDDRRQTALATRFLAANQCYVLKTVLLELVWVLSSPFGYRLDRAVVAGRVRHILGLPMIVMEEALEAAQAIDWYEKGMDFGDALHLAASGHLKGFATMDGRLTRKATQVAPGSHTILVR
ncbi:MAG: type II toxin-antitoxin system VapC family toxin [Deltaproteobacteria bacterium]|nr:type II toxin-antitoxin system VapC family toxin [Deltaproteobacteria bacterium]